MCGRAGSLDEWWFIMKSKRMKCEVLGDGGNERFGPGAVYIHGSENIDFVINRSAAQAHDHRGGECVLG